MEEEDLGLRLDLKVGSGQVQKAGHNVAMLMMRDGKGHYHMMRYSHATRTVETIHIFEE